MSKSKQFVFGEDGKAREMIYDDRYDITIHCESQEEHNRFIERMKEAKSEKWTPVLDEIKEVLENVSHINDGDTISRQMIIKAVSKSVRDICEGARLEFLFITEGASEWSVSRDKHIFDVMKYHMRTEHKGRWIDGHCTACGGRECTVNVGELARFCPHCGTPMEVDG